MNTPIITDPLSTGHSGDGLGQPESRAARVSRKATAAIDAKRDSFAVGIQSAATSLHDHADRLPGGAKVARAAHTTAHAMEMAADYLREQDVRAMMADARQVVKRHPGATLLTALAVGFLLARTLSRR